MQFALVLRRSSRGFRLGVLAAVAVVVSAGPASAERAPASTGVLLGQGYDGAGGVPRAGCVDGDLDYEGNPQSTVRDDRPVSEAELRAILGLTEPDGGAALAVPSSQVLSFLQTAAPQSAAVVVTYAYGVRGKRAVLRSPRLSANGQVAATLSDAERLRMCGDEVVTGIELGGSVLITLRFDFATSGVRTLFTKSFDFGHVSAANLRGKLGRIGSEYKGKVTITLGALQLGGDVTKLAAIFGNPSGDIALLRCQVDQVDKCAQAMDEAHAYIFGVNGFREQLGDVMLDLTSTTGPAILGLETQSYDALKLSELVAPNPSRESARAARARMVAHHARLWEDVQRLSEALGRMLTSTQERLVSEALAIARHDAALLSQGIELCGSHSEACATVETQVEAALRPYSTRVADAPEWFLPLCLEAALGTEADTSIRPILEYFSETDCARAARLLQSTHAMIVRGAGILDGRVFAWLDNMMNLDARDNGIADATPFATLPNVRTLNLAYNNLTRASPLLDMPRLQNVRLQGNAAVDTAPLRARLGAESLFTEGDVCQAHRRSLLANGAISQVEYAHYEAADAAPVYSSRRTIVRWAPCAEAARALDP